MTSQNSVLFFLLYDNFLVNFTSLVGHTADLCTPRNYTIIELKEERGMGRAFEPLKLLSLQKLYEAFVWSLSFIFISCLCVFFPPESSMKMNVVSQRKKLLLQNMKTHDKSRLIYHAFAYRNVRRFYIRLQYTACFNRSVPLLFCSAGWSPLDSL